MNSVVAEDIRTILKAPIPWEKLKGARILITGASGMIGQYLVRTLLALNEEGYGIEVYGLLRHPEKLPEDVRGKIHILKQDVTEPIACDVPFTYIFHTASPASPALMREDPEGTYNANVLGAENTLALAVPGVTKGYLFLSSREVYGQPLEGQDVFTEEVYGTIDPDDPRSCYPLGKKAAEALCADAREKRGINTKAARLAHTFGPGMSLDDGRVQADFLRDVVNRRNITVKSDGTSVRTYTYAADAVAGLFYILLASPEEEMVYNISSDDVVTIRQLAEAMCGAFPERGLSVDVLGRETAGEGGTAPFTRGIVSAEKLKGLGWRPAFTLEEGIRRTVRHFEETV